jgi:uncharacterized protein YgiM (DUF1202 family)
MPGTFAALNAQATLAGTALMHRHKAIVLVLVAMLAGAGRAGAGSKESFWAVTGVAGDDALNLRDMPSADSRSLARIPANARGLRHLGCRRNQPPLEQWMRMSELQRREAQTEWCRVEYKGKQGWVAGRYLKRQAR